MYKYITAFFNFLAPIVRRTIVQVAADELSRVAYPARDYNRRPYTGYGYTGYGQRPRTRRQATLNVGRAVREADSFKPRTGPNPFTSARAMDVETIGHTHEGREFHDVLLVAFDISGRSAKDVQEWLGEQMPTTEEHGDAGEIYLDSWWIANDERFDGTDTDSAIFCKKGWQEDARDVLKENGLFH